MKVIDLLQRIANGEEVPKKIQVYSDIFVLDEGNKLYEHESTRTNLLSIYNGNILNYEVRIKEEEPKDIEVCGSLFTKSEYDKLAEIKEDKKIEKIGIIYYSETPTEAILHKKIDEIIDYINKEDK